MTRRKPRQKRRIHRTKLDYLVSNLRGEVGEVVTVWVLWKNIQAQATFQSSRDLTQDSPDRALTVLRVLAEKLRDEMISRLSELADDKIGRLNFHFAAEKLNALHSEATAFSAFIESRRFKEKRNYDISHKELPERRADHKRIRISDADLLRAIALALRLMKRIDRLVLGPASPHLWRQMRRRRYVLPFPARYAYALLPYLSLSSEQREMIVREEEREGRPAWTEMPILVNGRPAKVRVAKQWGVIDLSTTKFEDAKSADEGNEAKPANAPDELRRG